MEDVDFPFRVSPSEQKIIEHCPRVRRVLQEKRMWRHDVALFLGSFCGF